MGENAQKLISELQIEESKKNELEGYRFKRGKQFKFILHSLVDMAL